METPVTPKNSTVIKPYTTHRMLRHAFTGIDNRTVDIGRVIWFISSMAYIGISFIAVFMSGAWNPLEWGTGFAALTAGFGAALKLKENTEPVE